MDRKKKGKPTRELDLISNFMNLPTELAEEASKHPIPMHDLVEQVWNGGALAKMKPRDNLETGKKLLVKIYSRNVHLFNFLRMGRLYT